jgi:hypothetical protein
MCATYMWAGGIRPTPPIPNEGAFGFTRAAQKTVKWLDRTALPYPRDRTVDARSCLIAARQRLAGASDQPSSTGPALAALDRQGGVGLAMHPRRPAPDEVVQSCYFGYMAARTPDHIRLQILALATSGHSQRQICRRLGVSKSTVQRTLAAATDQPSHAPADPVEVPAQPSPANARGMLAAVVEGAAELVDRALAYGDMGAAQRAVVDLREGAGALRRLESTLEVGGIRMTMREIQAGMAAIYGRARELIAESGPVHCESCGVELRAAPMGADLPAPQGEPEPAPTDESPAAPRAREAYDRSTTVRPRRPRRGKRQGRAACEPRCSWRGQGRGADRARRAGAR